MEVVDRAVGGTLERKVEQDRLDRLVIAPERSVGKLRSVSGRCMVEGRFPLPPSLYWLRRLMVRAAS